MLIRLSCLCLAWLLLAGPSAAQAPKKESAAPVGSLYLRAEKLYAENRLAEAEKLYRQGLTGDFTLRRACLNRILPLYARLGRYDQAIRTAAAARPWLLEREEQDRLRLLSLQLGDYYLQLGHARTAEKHLGDALADGPGTLARVHQVAAWSLRASAAGRLGESQRCRQLWARVERMARGLLEETDARLTPHERMDCLRNLVDSYRQRGLTDSALRELRTLYGLCLQQPDPATQRDVLRELAGLYAERKEHAAAYRCLLGALDRHRQQKDADLLTPGDLCRALARLAGKMRWRERAASWRARAVTFYEAVLRNPRAGQPELAGVLAAFWRLHQLFQETSQLHKALTLGTNQEEAFGPLVRPRLRAEQGLVEAYLGAYARSRGLLRDALSGLDEQDPPNLLDLPRALNNLAVVEQATNQLDRAEKLVRRCLDLYRRESLPADLVQVEAHNLLGSFLAHRGEYAQAIDQFRLGIGLAERLGQPADRQHCNLLLNTALLHKAQGDMERAFEACARARVVLGRDGDPPALTLAAFDAALASLRFAQDRLGEAAALADRVLERCRQAGVERGLIVANAHHYQALRALAKGDVAGAAKTWEKVRALQEGEKQTLLLPRTLNYLALIEERSGRADRAEALYRQALALQQGNPRAFPATHFITLWRLGALAEARGKQGDARALLERALDVAEDARLRTYGDAQQRAGYLAQFAPAFEALLRLCLRGGDVEAALRTLDRSRSRTLLDQLQLANVDPLSGLPADRAGKLRAEEARLRRAVAALRARAQLLPLEALDSARAKQLTGELERAQKDHAELWREILNASPVYRSLLARTTGPALLENLRRRVLRPGTLLLAYHLSDRQGHALLVGPSSAEVFPLRVSAGVARTVAPAPAPAGGGKGTRSLEVRRMRLPVAPRELPARAPAGPSIPLTLPVARALLEQYRDQIADPDFQPTRELYLRPRKADQPVPPQRPELLGDIFLPEALRKSLRQHGATQVVVVPDGPLHKLPLEALLLHAGEKPRYVLDELPPLVYVPSLSVLALLGERPPVARKGPPSLLTVGNPAYRQVRGQPTSEHAAAMLALRGELPLLPGTHDELLRVSACFARDRVVALEGAAATERAVVAALPGRSVIHLAVHGFADARFGNLFGGLALAPPEKGNSEDDGFLSLHEVYQLRLAACELAVLSACSTNVGPQRPLEAGVTLATGFLAAGARRVVASHWSVDDRSTAELMGTFLAAWTDQEKPQGCAEALHRARLAVRGRKGWESPFHWAPFVLLGPPDPPK
jgi:CHAT domain-containing protein/Tfp pilus assembly protein PilF